METQMFEIVSGPSKFDFIASASFRKQDTQKVVFRVKDIRGSIEDFEVEILAILQCGPREDGEGHWWRFVTSYPWAIRNDNWTSLGFMMLGIYSTGGRHGRRGTLRSLSSDQSCLIEAAFGSLGAWNELKDGGFRLPDTRLPFQF
jgi:hypothetical protein